MSWLIEQSCKRLRNGDLIGVGQTIAWSLRERYYEQLYDISSSAPVPVAELGTDTSLSEDYDPTSYLILRKIFRRLWSSGRNNNHGFLDVGCGKGRVTRVAATHMYKQVIGIELSPGLVQAARRNLEQSRRKNACADVQVLQANAASFDMPDTIGTVFMYNPFRGATMDSFMENLRRSFKTAPRDITVVFVNPVRFEADRYPWMRAVDRFHCFYPHYDSRKMEVVIFEARRDRE